MKAIINRSVFVLMISLALVGCDNRNEDMLTVHDVYSNLLKAGSFPKPIGAELKELLEGSSDFRMNEYYELDLVISNYCFGTKSTWRDSVKLLPMKAIGFVFPTLNSFGVFSNPEILIIRQVEAANTCVFNPLTKYIED